MNKTAFEDKDLKRANFDIDKKRQIVLHCTRCDKLILEAVGDWELLDTSLPVYCNQCYVEACETL